MHTATRLRPRSAIVAFAAFGALLAGAPVADAQTNVITTVTGTTVGFGGDSGPATSAQLSTPTAVAATADGGFLIADQGNSRVRRVLPDGTIVTVAGSGGVGAGGDGGPATSAQFNAVNGVAMTPDGGFLVSDSNNNRVRRVSPGGTITNAAGTGLAQFTGDNIPATSAGLAFPVGVAVMADGGFLIGDNDTHRVRRVNPGGTITTVAGNGIPGSIGDGGSATAARLNGPAGVSVAADGAFLIAELDANRIRRVGTDGTITTVAGTGTAGNTGDGGPATAARINGPVDVAATPDGGFVVADSGNHAVRRVAPDGTISTLAGNGAPGLGGDGGPASAAQLNGPFGVASTAGGDVLIADTSNSRVRLIDADLAPPVLALPEPMALEPDRDADTIPDARDNCPVTPNRTQSDRDADGIGDACDGSDASTGPTLARTVVAQVVSGEVFVRLPSTRPRAAPAGRTAQALPGFVPLRGAAILPVGTVADTRRGRVAITSVATMTGRAGARTQRADFFDGIFQIRQRRASQPVTDILVRSTSFPRVCGSSTPGASARTAQRRSRRVVSRLWGDGRGRFRTEGRHSSATVRGTIWLTEERCDGTLTRVRRGSVTVRDKVARRTVIVRAGRTYLARRAARARSRGG